MSRVKTPIPIKNIFFMLCYAWNILSIKDTIKLQSEDLDNAYNLLTRLLVFGVQKLVRRGFLKNYIQVNDDLTCLRGKININETIRRYSRNEKQCNCEYEEFSKNNSFNKIIKHTIISTLKNASVNDGLKKELRTLLVYFNGIEEVAPSKSVLSQLRFNLNNKHYRMITNVCNMIYSGTLVNEKDGDSVFKDFFREEQMQKVYENFVLNFYRIQLDSSKYSVQALKFSWQLGNEDEDVWDDEEDISLLPELRTDIVITNKLDNVQLIIDTKYYEAALSTSNFGNTDKFRREHISQVQSYMTNSGHAGIKRGALLYPSVSYELKKQVKFPFGTVFFRTIDLKKDWQYIEKNLLEFSERANKHTKEEV